MGLFFIVQAVLSTSVACVSLWLLSRYTGQRSLRIVPGPSSPSFIVGNMKEMFSFTSIAYQDSLNKLYGKVVKIKGLLGVTTLVISDTKALHHILIKDQYTFEETDWFLESNRVIFGPGLLSTLGASHRKQRKILNPAFSINHMRRMIPMFQSLTRQVQGILRKELADGPKELDILEWMGKLALELIAQAGLGHSFGALQGKDDTYAYALKAYLPTVSSARIWRTLVPVYTRNVPKKLQRSLAETIPSTTLKKLIGIADIFYDRSKYVWDRKKALHAQGDDSMASELGEGRDLMSILLRSNTAANEEDRLPDEELLAQMATLLFAGTDTTSSALSRILHQLALHPNVQEKLRKETIAVDAGKGELDYDSLIALPYLDAVCRETLRLFPPVHFVQRSSRKEYLLPLAHPMRGTDGRDYTELLVPNNTTVMVNILGVNRDPDIWGPDAHEWKPERWLSPLPESVVDSRIPGVYSNQMTFIGGGRACIGFKFSQLEMKVVLSQLLSVFRFSEPAEKEIIWRWGAVVSPSISGDASGRSQLPMKVSLV
ncbi:cytochrome P450 [Amylostereum chailletii]|nr:cytochrome P450 [Amylostereum chailletii]